MIHPNTFVSYYLRSLVGKPLWKTNNGAAIIVECLTCLCQLLYVIIRDLISLILMQLFLDFVFKCDYTVSEIILMT